MGEGVGVLGEMEPSTGGGRDGGELVGVERFAASLVADGAVGGGDGMEGEWAADGDGMDGDAVVGDRSGGVERRGGRGVGVVDAIGEEDDDAGAVGCVAECATPSAGSMR